jgi:hypothetical protein
VSRWSNGSACHLTEVGSGPCKWSISAALSTIARPSTDHGVWSDAISTSRSLNRWSSALKRRTNRLRKLVFVHLLASLVWPDRCILKSSSLTKYGDDLKIPEGSTTPMSLGACGSLFSLLYVSPASGILTSNIHDCWFDWRLCSFSPSAPMVSLATASVFRSIRQLESGAVERWLRNLIYFDFFVLTINVYLDACVTFCLTAWHCGRVATSFKLLIGSKYAQRLLNPQDVHC